MTIRVYAYSGYTEVDRQPHLKEPYLGRFVVKPGETSDPAPKGTRLALLVADSPCTYEITPEGHAPRIADRDSLKLAGGKVVSFCEGWTLSVWQDGKQAAGAIVGELLKGAGRPTP